MKRILLAAAAFAALASPSQAALQLSAQIGGDSFLCVDNASCDSDATLGVINTAPVILDGILFSSSSAAAVSGPTDFLNAANLLITNTNSSSVTITITASDTGFSAPVSAFAAANSGVWQGGGLSAATFKWFIDAANAQGASTPFDTPGSLVDSDISTSVPPTLAFSRNSLVTLGLVSPYSMTEQTTIALGAGESLVNRGQSIITTEAVIPETRTWVMMGLGFALMAALGVKRRSGRFAI
jgi:hypothetical protein